MRPWALPEPPTATPASAAITRWPEPKPPTASTPSRADCWSRLDRRPEHSHRSMKVAVLASGAGTNLQALLDSVHLKDGIEIVAVASDRGEAPALERARGA